MLPGAYELEFGHYDYNFLSAIALAVFGDFEDLLDLGSHMRPLGRVGRLLEASIVISFEALLLLLLHLLGELGVHEEDGGLDLPL